MARNSPVTICATRHIPSSDPKFYHPLIVDGGKQWQTTPKNLPRMQRTRAIPVSWLSSGLCPDRPKG